MNGTPSNGTPAGEVAPDAAADARRAEQNTRGAVLVPAGINPATYQCLRSLGRRGIHTIVASDDEGLPEFASRYCDERVAVPPPSEDLAAYRDALLSVAARPRVRTVIPCREADAYLLSKYRDAFAAHVTPVVPSAETLETAHDRVQLAAAAREAGVPVPGTWPLDEAPPDRELVVKSRYNLLTGDYAEGWPAGRPEERKGVTYLDADEEPDVESQRERLDHVPVAQEFVPKDGEYMVGALYDRGEPLATCQHRQVRANSYLGGGGVYRKSVYEPDLESAACDLLGHIDWHGLACLEYVRNAETGEFELLEHNPRMWQSLPASVCSGADFPYSYWLQATGRGDEIEAGYETGVGCHLLYGEVGYLLSLLRDDSPLVERPALSGSVRDVLASCLTDPHFDFLHLDDPGPFVRGLGKLVS